MRLFLFKLLFRFTWWVAPDRKRVDQMCDIYLALLDEEDRLKTCEDRQREMDACIRPRTETGERPTRSRSTRRHYTDYDEAQAYHDGKKTH